ncbi:hypothetical protein BpHYR1_025141 [Brachionus plicatilis]|uniref:Uncharacterized protein n=1 Tax=Brachionus plicatilis TaxID=10195 RepID=A0A3M7RSJ7_BRAPC|nr:hypothetical protein BpHYR1_025141 [Brachionus plicatilis]
MKRMKRNGIVGMKWLERNGTVGIISLEHGNTKESKNGSRILNYFLRSLPNQVSFRTLIKSLEFEIFDRQPNLKSSNHHNIDIKIIKFVSID